MVPCKTKRVRLLLEKLSAGGDKNAQICGWLKDKYGVSWQVFPAMMTEILKIRISKEPIGPVSLQQMKKLDIKTLEKAYWS